MTSQAGSPQVAAAAQAGGGPGARRRGTWRPPWQVGRSLQGTSLQHRRRVRLVLVGAGASGRHMARRVASAARGFPDAAGRGAGVDAGRRGRPARVCGICRGTPKPLPVCRSDNGSTWLCPSHPTSHRLQGRRGSRPLRGWAVSGQMRFGRTQQSPHWRCGTSPRC